MGDRCLRWIGYCTALLIASLCLTECSVSSFPSGGTLSVATPTPLSSGVPSPSPQPPTCTPTPSPIVPPTFTLRPTLTADERQALVREMLETNGGCELPCWWGVTPSQADWQIVKNRFTGYGGFVFEIPHPTRPYDYYLKMSFDHQDGIVRSIRVIGYIFPGGKSERFAQDWHRYSLDQVLTRYGEPSQVMLEFWPNPPGPYYPYGLFVFYDHKGVLIEYGGSAIPGEPFRICPQVEGVEYLRLWLRSPGEGPALLDLADLDPVERAQMLPLEKATGMDVETFYKTFKEPDTKICLESPAEVWP